TMYPVAGLDQPVRHVANNIDGAALIEFRPCDGIAQTLFRTGHHNAGPTRIGVHTKIEDRNNVPCSAASKCLRKLQFTVTSVTYIRPQYFDRHQAPVSSLASKHASKAAGLPNWRGFIDLP